MKIVKVFLLAILGLSVSNMSMAWNQKGATTFTLAGAYYDFASKRHLDNAMIPNIMLDYNLSERWAVEGGVGVINTNQSNSNQGVQGYLYTVDGLYRFNPHQRLEPYVLGGVGIFGLNPNGNQNKHQGNVNAGIGTQFFADPSIALRGEVRDIYTLSGGKNDVMINFGVSYLFDNKKGE